MAPPNVAEIDPANSGKMFSAKDIPEIVKLFREADADGGGGLDIEEFCVAMKKLYGFVDKEKLTALHMQIDTNCDKTVDLGELMDFLLKKNKASECLDYKNQPFPKPFKIIRVDHHKAIVRLFFRDFVNKREKDYDLVDSADQTRIYQKGQYISISSDGVLKFWTDRFELTHSFPLYKTKEALPYSHEKKMHVNDMVHIRELSHVAVATNEKELLFYNCSNYPDLCELFYSLKVEEIVTHMNYWFSNAKGAFSFVDIKGYLYVFISYRIQANGLFYRKANEKMSKRGCLTINVSSLLKNPSPEFFCFKVHVLNGMCRQIQYFKSLESFAICNSSSTRMVLVTHPKSNTPTVSKKVFGGRGDYEYFNCAEYSHSAGQLLTGGADGLLRVWFPYKNVSYEHVLKGHVRPITHIMFNPNEKTLISLSDDLNVCVWSEDGWMCRQNIQAYGMERAPISSVFYNIYNNELVFANSDIATCLGRGTDLFKKMLTSHDKPLCSLLYHDIFKQVVSVCKNGVVTVWDIVTGKAVMQFKVTPKQHVGFTAISFDGPQRRLITISKDGKVRLWNFNNGTELSVLPHNVPKKVTGIICINNRMFVSGRHSNIIFNLDMDKIDHRFLEHDFLNDIISMDVHDGLLVTAASNGNVVCWDAETGDALYWFNVSMSPRTQMVTKTAEGRTGRLSKKQPFMDNGRGKKPAAHDGKGRKGPLLLCLKTREDNIDTATVLTAEGSYIYAWSISSKGGVLGKFRAVKEEDAFVTTMSTDASEQILLTGDSKGMIYLWDIEEFGFKNQADTAPFEEIQGWHVPLCPPPLLGSWKAHLTGVVSVKCDPTCENILTAGLDCNVWLWTNTGSCKGLFGRDQWDLTQALPEETSDQEPAEKTGEAKKAKVRKKPFIKPIPIPPPSPTASLPDFTDLYESIKEAIRPRKAIPILSDAEIYAKCANVDRTVHNLIRQMEKVKHSKPHDFKSSQKSPSEAQKESCPPDTTQSTGRSEDTDDSQSAGVGTDPPQQTPKHPHLPPIPHKVPLTPDQNQFKPHPPLTPLTGGTGRKQSSAPFNQNWQKYRRILRDPRPDHQESTYNRLPHISGKIQLIPQPPQPQLTTDCTNDGNHSGHMEQNSNYLHLPPISDKVQLTGPQTHLLQTPFARHGTEHQQSSLETASPCLNQTRSRHGRVLNTQPRDSLKVGAFTPCRPNVPPGKQGADQTRKSIHLPPISDKVQLTQHHTPFRPHPPQTLLRSGTNLKQSSAEAAPPCLNQTRSRYGRVLNLPARDAFKVGVPTSHPPNILTDKRRPVQTSGRVRLPPISTKVEMGGKH